MHVAGIAPLDRRAAVWETVKAANPGINEVAMFGTLDNPIANSVANQARSVLSANPNIQVMFAPYDEFAKGVKIAVDEAGLSSSVVMSLPRRLDNSPTLRSPKNFIGRATIRA